MLLDELAELLIVGVRPCNSSLLSGCRCSRRPRASLALDEHGRAVTHPLHRCCWLRHTLAAVRFTVVVGVRFLTEVAKVEDRHFLAETRVASWNGVLVTVARSYYASRLVLMPQPGI